MKGPARRASRRGGARVRGGRDRGAAGGGDQLRDLVRELRARRVRLRRDREGYFRDAGFELKVTSGTGSVDNIKLAAAGRLDYTPVDIGALMVTRANEACR